MLLCFCTKRELLIEIKNSRFKNQGLTAVELVTAVAILGMIAETVGYAYLNGLPERRVTSVGNIYVIEQIDDNW